MELGFKIGGNESGGNLISSLGSLWQKYHKYVLLFVTLLFIGYAGWIWRSNLMGGEWTEEKKQEYLSAQSKSVIFREADFKKAAEDFESRKKQDIKDKSSIKDIFRSY